jgi:hypothetical protein
MIRAFDNGTRQTNHVTWQEYVFPVRYKSRDTDGIQEKKIRGCVVPAKSTGSAAKHMGFVLVLVEE